MFIFSSPSSGQPHLQGICITCKRAAGCFIRQQADDAIWTCHQYTKGETLHYQSKNTHTEQEGEKARGLCMNCEHSSNCSLQQEGKVIFHCEEYE